MPRCEGASSCVCPCFTGHRVAAAPGVGGGAQKLFTSAFAVLQGRDGIA